MRLWSYQMRWTSILGALTVAVVLSGCNGGGGGGGAASGGAGGGGAGSSGLTQLQLTQQGPFSRQVADAAGSIPNQGSVTQSSNMMEGITQDTVNVTATRDANGQVTFAGTYDDGSGGDPEVRIGTANDLVTRFSGERICDQCDTKPFGDNARWNGAELKKTYSDGTLWVDVYTDIEAPTTREVSAGDPASTGTVDVPVGTTFQRASGITSTTGGGQSHRGSLDGAAGVFRCPSGCSILGGEITGGKWTFTPDRPPGARDVPGTAAGVVFTGEFDRTGTSGTFNGQSGSFRCISTSCGQSTSNGRLSALRGTWIFIPASGRTVTEQDTDYLAGGVWLYVPNSGAAADFEFGAFADGGDPFNQNNIMALTGTATYQGDATAVYTEKESATATATFGYFDADVRLTADFGDGSALGTISGVINNMKEDGMAVDGNPSLNLGSAAIGDSNSGFFNGDTAMTHNDRSYAGKWGGQFYGNGDDATDHPGSVAGTFGGATSGNTDGYEASFVGAYGAYKQ